MRFVSILFLSLLYPGFSGAQSVPQCPDTVPASTTASAPIANPISTSPIEVDAKEPAILRDGSGAQRMKITNKTSAPVPLKFTMGNFYDETARSKIEGPKVTFSLDSGGNLPDTLLPGQSLEAIADFKGFTGSLAAHATLFNKDESLIKVRLVAVDTPLNIGLDGAGVADNPISYRFKNFTTINLRNSGKDYVTLDWTFVIGSSVERTGCATLIPGGLAQITLNPTSLNVYSIFDTIRPRKITGQLLLRPHTPPGVDTSLFNLQPLPVSLVMERRSQLTTELWFAVFVMVFLLVGAILSLLSNAILPDIQKKLAFEKRVATLADRTTTISTRVNSYLRVLLRLDRKKIELALKDVRWYSLNTGEKIDAAAADMDRLDKRLTITETLDRMQRQFEDVSTWAPPSASDLIDQTLEDAASRLRVLDLTDEILATANALLARAQLAMDDLQNDVLQTQRVSDKFKQIKSRLDVFPKDYYDDLRAALPGIFNVFDEPFETTDQLVPSMLFAIDHAITAGHIALDYAMVRATIARSGPLPCGTPGANALARLSERHCRLLELLGTLSWKALRGANLLVQQMREDIYETDVLAEIKKHRDQKDQIVRIAYDTMRVRPYLPVFFSLAFDNPRFANAAALRCVIFRWSFPKALSEDSATVCHYFVGDEPAVLPEAKDTPSDCPPDSTGQVQCAVQPLMYTPLDNKDKKLRKKMGFLTRVALEVHCPDFPDDCALLAQTVHVDQALTVNSRTGVEFARFLLAFGAALVVLEAGVMDQLKKLDLLAAIVAVVALGFGADSIKNILGQTAKPAPPPPPPAKPPAPTAPTAPH